MANLSIRKLDDLTYEQLRIRAAQHKLSMEEEARQIIYHAVMTLPRISDIFLKNFGAKNGVDLDKINPRKPHQLWI